jgi:hypothetical protein
MTAKPFNLSGSLLLALTLLVATSCKSSDSKVMEDSVTYWVNSARVPCVGVGPMECLQVRKSESADWQLFYSEIEGFDFEPGYVYRLRVREEILDPADVPADASSIRFVLLEVEEKKPD